MTRVFLLGASGFVGGQILKELSASSPKTHVSALVRNKQAVDAITKTYPSVQVVVGSLDDSEIVSEHASQADVVLNAASNKHMIGARAIHNGLKKRASPSYWVQISGASLLASRDLASPSYDVGRPPTKTYDDLDKVSEIRSLIADFPKREIDNYLLDVSKTSPNIRTALIFPPIIYGKGQGPVNQRSVQIPALSKVTLERGHAVQAGKGQNKWSYIHVADIARLFTGLAEQGALGKDNNDLWNENGLYLSSAGDVSFAELADKISKAANEQGLINSAEIEELSKADSDTTLPAGSIFFGSNAVGDSKRARQLLGWQPRETGLDQEIPRAVANEASLRA